MTIKDERPEDEPPRKIRISIPPDPEKDTPLEPGEWSVYAMDGLVHVQVAGPLWPHTAEGLARELQAAATRAGEYTADE